MKQLGGFQGRLIGPLVKPSLPLIVNVLKTLVKSVLVPLGLKAATSATDTAIRKKMFGSDTKTLVFSNEDLNDMMKIVKSLEESVFLKKGVSETAENEV